MVRALANGHVDRVRLRRDDRDRRWAPGGSIDGRCGAFGERQILADYAHLIGVDCPGRRWSLRPGKLGVRASEDATVGRRGTVRIVEFTAVIEVERMA